MLENIRSAYNVGAIFRTADGAGVSKLLLVGYTPTPIDRFGRTQPEIAKTSLGASTEIPWEHHQSSQAALAALQADGFQVVVIEQAATSQTLPRFVVPAKVVYVFGNEVEGVQEETQAQADAIVDIPMLGTKESLNVSVAAGIVLYHGMVNE